MAIDPDSQYPGQTEAPDADYPYGGAKNETVVDALDGTPFEKAMLNDIFGLQQSLLDKAEIVPSGNSETAPLSQYREALELFMAQTQNYVINGVGVIAQRADYTLVKDAYDFGPDRFEGMATGTLVSAGTLTRTAAANIGVTGFAHKFNQVTLTGTGILFHRTRIESKDAKNFKNLKASLSCKVYHDVGAPVDYTLTVRKANAEDDFSATTDIANDGGTSVADTTATTLAFEDISMGDCSNGIEVELKIECGAVTLKDFEQTEYQLKVGLVATPFKPEPIESVLAKCQRYYEKTYELDEDPGTTNTTGIIIINSVGAAVGRVVAPYYFKVSKRTKSPTVTLYNPGTGATGSMLRQDAANIAASAQNIGQGSAAAINTAVTIDAVQHRVHATVEDEL